jgi:hypothetical protein
LRSWLTRAFLYEPGSLNYRKIFKITAVRRVISWEPGQDTGDGSLRFGGWVWRYDLAPAGRSKTTVTLSYDWSAVPDFLREHIGFPPFPPDHLGNSLAHLAELATA